VAALEQKLLQLHQVRMTDFLERPKLVLEGGDSRRALLSQHLQCDACTAFAIERFVHDAVCPAPKE